LCWEKYRSHQEVRLGRGDPCCCRYPRAADSSRANRETIGHMFHLSRGPNSRMLDLPWGWDRRKSATIVQHAEGRGKGSRTHGSHERICGEVIDTSGDLAGTNLTGTVRALEPILQHRAKASATDLGIRVDLREHRRVVIVGEKSNLGGGSSPCSSSSFKSPAQSATHPAG
jgi:hypothetical protein